MAVLKPLKGGYFIWKYLPSLPAAVVFALIFLAVTTAHGWRLYRTRLWLCIPIFAGGLSKIYGIQR